MKKLPFVVSLIVCSMSLSACESKEVKACKNTANNLIEELCKSYDQMSKHINDEYILKEAQEIFKEQYPYCFDKTLMEKVKETIDLQCEADPSSISY